MSILCLGFLESNILVIKVHKFDNKVIEHIKLKARKSRNYLK